MRDRTAEILAADGPIARVLNGQSPGSFEPRPEQLEMARSVDRCMMTRSRLIAEAGTGVGKSYAYLVPALLRAMTSDERVVISTHTIALQEQLVKKDIPLLMETIEQSGGWGVDTATARPIVPTLVKGRNNYVSLRRLAMADMRIDRAANDSGLRRSLEVIKDWSLTTADGTLTSLPPLERQSIWERVQSDTDNCMGRKCPRYNECFYQKARQQMEGANILVTNHALFFADLSMRREEQGFLPDYHHVVFDEAHTVEDVACEHFGAGLAEGRLEFLLQSLYSDNGQRGYLVQLLLMCPPPVRPAVEDAMRAVREAHSASRAFFDEVQRLLVSGKLKNGRLSQPGMVTVNLASEMGRLAELLDKLKMAGIAEEDQFEVNSYASRARGAAADADVLVNQKLPGCVYWLEGGDTDSGSGSAPSYAGRVKRSRLSVSCAPIDVGPLLRQHLFGREISVVMTSATLATPGVRIKPVEGAASGGGKGSGAGKGSGGGGGSSAETSRPTAARPTSSRKIVLRDEGQVFVPDEAPGGGGRGGGGGDSDFASDAPAEVLAPGTVSGTVLAVQDAATLAAGAFGHFALRVGVDRAETLVLGSPFDHRKQVRFIVDRSVPSPKATMMQGGEKERYVAQLSARVLHHLKATEGGAFVLFTSFDLLRRVGDVLYEPLSRLGYPMLMQGADGSPAQVLEMFRKNEHSVLLGAASFWQGVDVKGRGLRNVIITRLPFEPPDRPLTEARCERIKQLGGDPFSQDSLPRAVIRFKQGFGRLIRSKTDTGRVVVLDSRVVTTGYGRAFVNALPPGVEIEEEEVIPEYADDFRSPWEGE